MKRLLCTFLLLTGGTVFAVEPEVQTGESTPVVVDVENIVSALGDGEYLSVKGDIERIFVGTDLYDGAGNVKRFSFTRGDGDFPLSSDIDSSSIEWTNPKTSGVYTFTQNFYDAENQLIESLSAVYRIQGAGLKIEEVGGGFFLTSQSQVKISAVSSDEEASPLDDAVIYYTLDGSVPTTDSAEYSGMLAVSAGKTIKAIAVYDGVTSGVTSYTVEASDFGCVDGGCSDGSTPGIPVCSNNKTDVYDGFFRKPLLVKSSYYEEEPGCNSHSIAGTITVKATWRSEKITATVKMNGTTYNFGNPQKINGDTYFFGRSAKIDGTYHLVHRNGSLLRISFCGNRVYGTLGGTITGNTDLAFEGARNRFKDKTDDAYELGVALKGYYNAYTPDSVTIKDSAVLPNFAAALFSLKVSNNGSARVTANLSDGSKASVTSSLIFFENGAGESFVCVPFDIPLYSKKGSISGLLFVNAESKDITTYLPLGDDGDLEADFCSIHWVRKDATAFSIAAEAEGGEWNYNAAVAEGNFKFSLSGLPAYWYGGEKLFADEGKLPWRYDVLYTGKSALAMEKHDSKLKLSVARTTGLISGSINASYSNEVVIKPRIRSVKFSGIMFRQNGYEGFPIVGGLGFATIAETNPAVKKILKKNSGTFTLIAPSIF